MDYKKMGDTIYVRMDRNDEIISSLMKVCEECGIRAATYSGIGGCKSAEIQTFLPDQGRFETRVIEGMLELITISGNMNQDEQGKYYHHTHAMFAYKENGQHCVAGGHMKAVTVLYTAEIELRPVQNGTIRRKYDPETKTGFWNFDE